MLKSILLIWALAVEPEAVAAVYAHELDYVLGESGVVAPALAHALKRPELAGRRYQTVYPPTGPQVGIRWVEGGAPAHRPMRRVGWSAIELLVADPDSLVDQLTAAGFEHLHGPAYLTDQNNIRAAQLIGPAHELLYVTHIEDPSRSLLQVVRPSSPVGHPFIMVAGSRNLEATQAFFERYFANTLTNRIPFRIDVLSDAYDLPGATLHELALVKFAEPFGLEFDQYPAQAKAQPLPLEERGGIILVTVSAEPGPKTGELPWAVSYDDDGEPRGGIVILPSGTPLEVRFE